MPTDYEYDVFLSYRRSPTSGVWVREHLAPLLSARLNDIAPANVRLSLDQEIETGANWPEDLKRRLKSSKVLLAVWSADYFRSAWCMAEWESFRSRNQFLVQNNVTVGRNIIYPIRYSDGRFYHEDAKQVQCNHDFSDLNHATDSFRQSAKYLDFDDKVKAVADDLLEHILAAPAWRGDFPIVEPEPMAPATIRQVTI